MITITIMIVVIITIMMNDHNHDSNDGRGSYDSYEDWWDDDRPMMVMITKYQS